MRKYSFCSRVVNIWNRVPKYVVEANSVNTFKKRLDKFWINQEVIYNHKCELTPMDDDKSDSTYRRYRPRLSQRYQVYQLHCPLPSNRQHLSFAACVEDKKVLRKIIRIALCCVV